MSLSALLFQLEILTTLTHFQVVFVLIHSVFFTTILQKLYTSVLLLKFIKISPTSVNLGNKLPILFPRSATNLSYLNT